MIIKSAKDYHLVVGITIVFMFVFTWILAQKGISAWFLIELSLVLVFLILRIWVSIGRTFVMDENGCTVSFLFFSHFYSWDSFKTKRLENYNNSIGYRQPYLEGVVFFEKECKKGRLLMPAEYSIFYHPFSFIYVYFTPPTNLRQIPPIYTVDKGVFLELLAKWEIDLVSSL